MYVNLWQARGPFGPHGIVHREGCGYIKDGPDWNESLNEQTADSDFTSHELFWCSSNICFGPDNPRRIRREL